MANLILHAGAMTCTKEDAGLVSLPEETSSYKPLPHLQLINNIEELSKNFIGNTDNLQLGLSPDGNKLFGTFDIMGFETDERRFVVGFRNSYDKTLAAGVCFGAKVLVCDNLAFSGEITILRKHTKNIIEDLIGMLVQKFMVAKSQYEVINKQLNLLAELPISRIKMSHLAGEAAYKRILTPTQITSIMREIKGSKHFPGENMYSFYNHGTQVLKTTPIGQRIEKLVNWDKFVNENVKLITLN